MSPEACRIKRNTIGHYQHSRCWRRTQAARPVKFAAPEGKETARKCCTRGCVRRQANSLEAKHSIHVLLAVAWLSLETTSLQPKELDRGAMATMTCKSFELKRNPTLLVAVNDDLGPLLENPATQQAFLLCFNPILPTTSYY